MINLKKIYAEHPEHFKDSIKFKMHLIDLYPNEKKAVINVLAILLSEGALACVKLEDKSGHIAFCRRICDDYDLNSELVEECFKQFAGLFNKRDSVDLSNLEKLEKLDHLYGLSALEMEFSIFDMYCDHNADDISCRSIPYLEERKIVDLFQQAKSIIAEIKKTRNNDKIVILHSIYREIKMLAVQLEGRKLNELLGYS